MPHFDEDGHDTWICQACGKIYSSAKVDSAWRPDITKNKSAGNVCPDCIRRYEARQQAPISVYEHCKRESGLTGHRLTQYINRYYGFG